MKLELAKKAREIVNAAWQHSQRSEKCTVEHHDGKLKLTRWNDNAQYTRTIAAVNVYFESDHFITPREALASVYYQLLKLADQGIDVGVPFYDCTRNETCTDKKVISRLTDKILGEIIEAAIRYHSCY